MYAPGLYRIVSYRIGLVLGKAETGSQDNAGAFDNGPATDIVDVLSQFVNIQQ